MAAYTVADKTAQSKITTIRARPRKAERECWKGNRMIKLWQRILLPLYQAARAKTILEIGAEYGKSTTVLLAYVKEHGGHLHCIDPYPAFEARQFAEDNREHLTFYEDLSLNAIRRTPRVDIAMVDGDHNWYTVYNELKQLEEVHGSDPLAQPVIFAHDLSWPYGRRDLYYNPDNIPAEFRQPHAKEGILPNKSELTPRGMNRHLHNATHEGGPRNGVLTGVEDYLAESKLNWHFLHLPLYFGLGILVTRERLRANPELNALIERFTPSEGSRLLIAQTEHLRSTDGIIMQVLYGRWEKAQQRIEELEAQLADRAQQ